jgi:heptaprenyl diphosphate synthase
MAGQLILVRFWLIPHAGVAYLVPLFMAAALLFGVINGLVTSHLLKAYPSPVDKSES